MIRHVERYTIQQPIVTLLQLIPDIVPCAGHRIYIEHLVGDLIRHRGPFALGGLLVEAIRDRAPSMGLEHDAIGAGRGVKRNLLANLLAHLVLLFLVVPDDRECDCGNLEILAIASRLLESLLDMRKHEFAQVLGRVERMRMQAVALFAGQPQDMLIEARDVDRDVRPVVMRRA